MNNLMIIAQSLLATLRSIGGVDSANRLQTQYESRDWQLRMEDVDQLTLEIKNHSEEPTKDAVEEKALACLDYFKPFYSHITDWELLVQRLSELGRVESFESCSDAIKDIFVNSLGFDEHRVEASSRLGAQKTISRLVSIADFEGFKISIAEMGTEVPYSNIYTPIFQIYPDGLCVVINTRRKVVKFVYTHGRGRQTRQLGYRSFVGMRRAREMNDNILTWAQRLTLIRPKFEDDRIALRDRVEVALSCTPSDLAQHWSSVEIEGHSEIPGPSWNELPATESASFIQVDNISRIHWGLESVLRDYFPLIVAKGRYQLDYLSYTLSETMPTDLPKPTLHTYGVTFILNLELSSCEPTSIEIQAPVKLEFPCFIPISDSNGHFVFDNRSYSFYPELLKDGSFSRSLLGESEGELVEDYSQLFIDTPEAELESGEDEGLEDEAEDVDATNFEGASLRCLLEVAVARKLAALANKLWRIKEQDGCSRDVVDRCFAVFSDRHGRIELWSKPFLASMLTPVKEADITVERRAISQVACSPENLPPAWACLEASSRSDGRLYPINSARLHPSGDLATPFFNGRNYTLKKVNCSAIALNERVAANTLCSKPRWWISPHLEEWAELPVGNIESAELTHLKGFAATQEEICCLASESVNSELCSVCLRPKFPGASQCDCRSYQDDSDSDVRLGVSPQKLAEIKHRNRIFRSTIFDVPARLNVDAPAIVRVTPGQAVTPGTPWLSISPATWAGSQLPQSPRSLVVLSEGIQQQSLPERKFLVRIPQGWKGKVTEVSVRRLYGKFGQVVAWRASLSIVSEPDYSRALLPDGRLVRLSKLNIEDAPYCSRTFDPFPIVLFEKNNLPAVDGSIDTVQCLSGETGREVNCHLLEGPIGWVPAQGTIEADAHIHYRLIDNAGIPGPTAPTLTENERLWLRLAYPEQSVHLDRAEERGLGSYKPWEPALGSIQKDLGLNSASDFVAMDAVVAGKIRWSKAARVLTDPTCSRIENFQVDSRGSVGGFNWQCNCGSLSGTEFVAEICKKCNSTVGESVAGANHWICKCGKLVLSRGMKKECGSCGRGSTMQKMRRADLSRIPLPLPFSILNPWRLNECAGLLGLTRSEFDKLLLEHSPQTLLTAVKTAFTNAPFGAIHQRIASSKGRKLTRELGRSLYSLQTWVESFTDQSKDSLELSSVPVVPSRFLFTGLPAGSPRVVHGALMKGYRRVKLAIEQAKSLKDSSSDALSRSAGIGLQTAVNLLYGDIDSQPSTINSFSDLVGRIWPLGRSPDLATIVPGLFQIESQLMFRGDHSPKYQEESTGKEEYQFFEVTLPSKCSGKQDNEKYWELKNSRSRLFRELLPFIAGMFGGLSKIKLTDVEKMVFSQLGIEETDNLSLIAVREALRSLDRQDSRPDKLLTLIDAELPIQLPKSAIAARTKLISRLNEVLPCTDVGSKIAIEALAIVLGGWWSRSPCIEFPLGWCWESPELELEKPWSRFVPTRRSLAWQLWPGMSAFMNSKRWLIGGNQRSEYLATALGFSSDLPRPRWWNEEKCDLELPHLDSENLSKPEVQIGDDFIADLIQLGSETIIEEPKNSSSEIEKPTDVERPSLCEGQEIRVLDSTLFHWLNG